tara:strand:- start:53 stop:175 length:123 start_codon:yes stop_codon:yes gene_type:complete
MNDKVIDIYAIVVLTLVYTVVFASGIGFIIWLAGKGFPLE